MKPITRYKFVNAMNKEGEVIMVAHLKKAIQERLDEINQNKKEISMTARGARLYELEEILKAIGEPVTNNIYSIE